MFDENFYRNPYPIYRKLRDAAPIHFSDKFGWDGAWLVTRYDGVARVYNDPNLSAARGHRFFDQYSPQTKAQLQQFSEIFQQWVIFLDPPEHGVWRKAMMSGFTTVRIKELQPLIAQRIDQLLDNLENKGTADFIREFCFPLPISIIGSLMSVRPQDNEQFVSRVQDIAAFFGNPGASVETGSAAQAAMVALCDYFKGIVAERMERPGNDMISLMIDVLRSSEMDENTIREKLPIQCTALIFGGHETTASLLGNGLYALFNHPDQLELLARNPSLAPAAAREIARYDTPGQFSTRIAARECEFLGQTVKPGQLVIGLAGSANRDERAFADPDVFRIERQDTATALTFGNGRHYCIGTQLALLEIALAFEKLVRRFPKIRPATDNVEWTRNANLRGIRSMPIQVN